MTSSTDPNLAPFASQVHADAPSTPITGLDQNTADGLRKNLVESILQLVVQAITGVFLPGPLGSAFKQLESWANTLGQTLLGPLVNLLVTAFDSIPIIGPPIGNAIEDLANLLGLVHSTATAAAQQSQDTVDAIHNGLTSSTSTGNPTSTLTGLFTNLQGSVTGAINSAASALEQVFNFGSLIHQAVEGLPTQPLYEDIEDFVAQAGAAAQNLVATATNAESTVISGFAALFNQWFNVSTAQGTVAEVAATFDSIKTVISGGYTVVLFSTNQTYTVPTGIVEFWAGAIGGGDRGQAGQGVSGSSGAAQASGGARGLGGGYRIEKIDPTTLPTTLAITIGTAGAAAGAAGTATSVDVLVTSVREVGSISSPQGYTLSSSAPGGGGDGGDASWTTSSPTATDGAAGDSSATATGGNGGAHLVTGAGAGAPSGSAGASGQTTTLPLTGGGGGGGGGGCVASGTISGAHGGTGGSGGFPGAGSGGGGAGSCNSGAGASASGGAPGAAANGMAFVMYK